MIQRSIGLAIAAAVLATAALTAQTTAPARPQRPPDVPFVPSVEPVINEMLALAKVTKTDVVYDLGCGDGRIVVAAASKYGARAVGIDIDPQRIDEANARAKAAGVTDKVKFILGDLFDPKISISEASVVTLYLLPSLNERLKPRLMTELKPGSRVVSNSFAMGDWKADKTKEVASFVVYLWTIPKR